MTQGIGGSTCKPALIQDTGYMVEKTYHKAPYLGASVTHKWFKMFFQKLKGLLECACQLTSSSIWSINNKFWSKTTPTDYISLSKIYSS